MPGLTFNAQQLAAARQREKEINAMGDRDYIVTVCEVIVNALRSPLTQNLDLSEIRTIVDQAQQAIEDKIYAQADKLGAPAEPTEPGLGDDALDDLDLGESTKKFNLQEAKDILLKSGYNID